MSDRTALLVIDMQIGLVEGAFRADAVLDRIADLIGRARPAHVLRRLDVTHVVVTGMQTEFCVDTTCRRAISSGLNVTRVSDAHTTIDATLPAETIIAHHNAVFPKVAHPRHHILERPSGDVTFGHPSAP